MSVPWPRRSGGLRLRCDAADQGAARLCSAADHCAVSSFAMKGDEEKARTAGCDAYVTKPYSPIQLLRIIRGFLDENA